MQAVIAGIVMAMGKHFAAHDLCWGGTLDDAARPGCGAPAPLAALASMVLAACRSHAAKPCGEHACAAAQRRVCTCMRIPWHYGVHASMQAEETPQPCMMHLHACTRLHARMDAPGHHDHDQRAAHHSTGISPKHAASCSCLAQLSQAHRPQGRGASASCWLHMASYGVDRASSRQCITRSAQPAACQIGYDGCE